MAWVAIVERARGLCGRDNDKTYVNVIASVRQLKVDASTFVAQNPTHPWADPGFKEFIVDIADQVAADVNDGTITLFHDGRGTLPRWQNENEGSASVYSPGSFADPEDDQSTFTAATPLEDDRWIVRVYDADPGTTGTHIAAMDLDEGQDAGETTVYLKLFNSDDSPSATNVQDAKTEIANKLMIFDFTAGVTTFGVATTDVGVVDFPSTGRYRVIGPNSETKCRFRVFGRVISVRR